jgi:hypothetical protein
MRQEVHADDGMRDVGYHESPSEIPVEAVFGGGAVLFLRESTR